MIAIRMLLKSCAIPPASNPSEARRPALARCSCARNASLMSRKAEHHAGRASLGVAEDGRAGLDRTLRQIARHQQAGAAQAGRSGEGAKRVVAALASVEIDVLEHGGERPADRLVARPAGQHFRDVVDQPDRAVEIARDHAVADAAEHHRQALLLFGERLLGPADRLQGGDRVVALPLGLGGMTPLVVEPPDENRVRPDTPGTRA